MNRLFITFSPRDGYVLKQSANEDDTARILKQCPNGHGLEVWVDDSGRFRATEHTFATKQEPQ